MDESNTVKMRKEERKNFIDQKKINKKEISNFQINLKYYVL